MDTPVIILALWGTGCKSGWKAAIGHRLPVVALVALLGPKRFDRGKLLVLELDILADHLQIKLSRSHVHMPQQVFK